MSEANTPRDWPTISDCAREAGKTEETIRNWCRKYKIGHKIGGHFRVNPAKFRAMLYPAPDGAEGGQAAA